MYYHYIITVCVYIQKQFIWLYVFNIFHECMSTQLLYTVTYIYTAGFEVVDTEIGREYIPERIYTRPWSTCMYIYCPEGKTKGLMTKQYLYLSLSSTLHLNLPGENRPVEYSALSINTFLKLEEFQISQKI